MKKAITVSIFVIVSAVSVCLALHAGTSAPESAIEPRIRQIHIEIDGRSLKNPEDPYRSLLGFRKGDAYNRQKIRNSIASLYKTEDFASIEIKEQRNAEGSINLTYSLTYKKIIHAFRFPLIKGIRNGDLLGSLFSLKRKGIYETSLAQKANEEIRIFLQAQGYLRAQVSHTLVAEKGNRWVDINWTFRTGEKTRVHSFTISVDNPRMKPQIDYAFRNLVFYIPSQLQKLKERAIRQLKAQQYYFPEITIETRPTASSPAQMDLAIQVICGFKYHFKFIGIPPRMDLIRSVWEKKVFEKWAESESQARILNYLNNNGYINAQVKSEIIVKENVKFVVFSAIKDRRYRLGKITIQGNQQVPESKLREIIQSDRQLFDRFFWLRQNSLIADRELLKLYYYYQGFAEAQILLQPSFHRRIADIDFIIEENQRYRLETIRFSGNRHFPAERLLQEMKSRPNGPFVQKQVNEDSYRLQNFYWNNGFSDARINFEMTPAPARALSIIIEEGTQNRLGIVTIIGGSSTQKNLIRNLFPLNPGEVFSKEKIDTFRSELESSSLFSEIRVETLQPRPDTNDVLVKVTPDRSRSYGFGVGWEERQKFGLRGTVEYQEKNIFNSISTVSALLQLTLTGYFKVDPFNSRGILAIDTPFFLKNKVQSTFSIWQENEMFPSYRYNRWGAGASFIKNFSDKVYTVASLKWYRTTITDLNIPPYRVDQRGIPFDTTALTFSLARDNRDDPFNPTSGTFLSSDLKIGLPIFQKDYTFLKFFWNFQRHSTFLKSGVLSFSIRNGFGFGDMSITERFFAGGSHSFRGTRNDRLGPVYINPGTGDAWPRGGNALILLNLEATFPLPLVPIKELCYSVFTDIGNVFEKSSHFDFGEMEKTLGIGLKYRTPMGPIRLDFAWNLRPTSRPRFLFQLGIGNVY